MRAGLLHTPTTLILLAVKSGSGFRSRPWFGHRHFFDAGDSHRPRCVSGRAAGGAAAQSRHKPGGPAGTQGCAGRCRRAYRAGGRGAAAIALRNDIALIADLIPLLDDKEGSRSATAQPRDALQSGSDPRSGAILTVRKQTP